MYASWLDNRPALGKKKKKKTLKFPFQREQTLANGRFKSIRGEMAERWKDEIYICLHEP